MTLATSLVFPSLFSKKNFSVVYFYASATKHLGIGMSDGWSVGRSRHKFQKSSHTHARRRETSYDIARLLLMVPMEPWRNSTPFFGAAAFCTTKIDDFRASSTLSSLTTWLRRPLRKDQLGGTVAAFSTTKIDDFRASLALSSLTTLLRRP